MSKKWGCISRKKSSSSRKCCLHSKSIKISSLKFHTVALIALELQPLVDSPSTKTIVFL